MLFCREDPRFSMKIMFATVLGCTRSLAAPYYRCRLKASIFVRKAPDPGLTCSLAALYFRNRQQSIHLREKNIAGPTGEIKNALRF